MGLLAPWFLLGALAVGLPVWLHLLRRRHSPPREFSSLMFFERRWDASVRRRRLEYLLLLALRCAVLLALTLAFARPYWETATAAVRAEALHVLALDDSFSMRQGSRMARARQQALAELARLGPTPRVAVMSFAGAVRLLCEPGRDPAAARAAIESLQPSDSRSSYAELARGLRALAADTRGQLTAHVFTDLQKTSWPASFSDLALPSGVVLRWHPVVREQADNWTVEAVRAPACVFSATPVRVQATLASFARQPARRRVSLVLDDRVLESREVEIPAAGRATVEFLLSELRHGVHRGEVRQEPTDLFAEDDRRRFVIERADPRPALFVHEARDRRSWLYFRTALEASPRNAYRLEEAEPQQLAGRRPDPYAFVVLSDVTWLPADFAAALRSYVEHGGAVWVTVGPAVLAQGRAPLLEAPIAAEGGGSGFQRVSEMDASHPILAAAGRWEGVKFFRAAQLEPGGARVLARLLDGRPLLMEKWLGAGRVLVFASAFDNLANDLPLHAVFVPFVERAAAYLGGAEERIGAVTVDADLVLRSRAEGGVAVEVIGPDGRRVLSLREATTAAGIPARQAGYYEIRRGNGRNETVAVNPDARESDLEPVPAETIALWSGEQTAGESGVVTEGERTRQSPWRWLLLAALTVAVLESWVANRYLVRGSEGI